MAIVNITCENDADFYRQFAYASLNSDGVTTTPIDLTGDTLKMGIRFNATDIAEQLLLTSAPGGGLAIVSAPGGTFTVRITQGQLVALEIGDYSHSLIRVTPDPAQYRIWSGTLTINPGPSR